MLLGAFYTRRAYYRTPLSMISLWYTIHMDEQPLAKMLLRMPATLRVALGEAAQRSRRSVTAEIVHRLEHSIRADERRERRRQADHERGGPP